MPSSTSVAPIFPFYENTSDWDDFGEVINPDDYVIKDEDMDQSAMRVSACFFVPSELDYFRMLYLSIFILLILGFIDTVVSLSNEIALYLSQTGGDMDGKLDEGSASLILDTTPSKVISNELTVS